MADGAAILGELDTKLLQKLYDRQIRISVSNLDVPPGLPGFVKEGFKNLVDAAVAPKFDMDLEMMYEKDGTPGRLQVREQEERARARFSKRAYTCFGERNCFFRDAADS